MSTIPSISEDAIQKLYAALDPVFEVQDITRSDDRPEHFRFRGRLLIPANEAYDRVGPQFEALGYTALFREDEDGDHMVLAQPGVVQRKERKTWVNGLLLALTVLSVGYAGLFYIAPVEAWTLAGVWPGLSFAASLLGILLAHEMGHYLMARRVGVALSLPYFIPFPLSFFGTMGAAEIMEGRPRDRRALLAVGAAGPLAGLAIAIPVLIIGLLLSEVQPIPTDMPTFTEGNSLLYLFVKYVIFGRILPSGGEDVFIHPIAFAGWGGLLVTSLNLIPVGQLDGGHIIYALFGKRVRWLIWPVLVALILLGLQWSAWYVWAALLFLMGRVYAEPLDDITRLQPRERAFAFLMLIIFALVFIPVPFRIG